MITSPYTAEKAQMAKAILPFFIIIHHCQYYDGLHWTKYLGVFLVSIFFLMSGFGLMHCYLTKQGYLDTFFKKRIPKVLIPVCLIYLVFIAVFCIGMHRSLIEALWGDQECGLRYTWFVWVLLAAYSLFYCIFRTNLANSRKIWLFSIITIGYFLIGLWMGIPRFLYASSIAFPLGLIWRYCEKSIISLLSEYKTLPVLILLGCLLLLAIGLRYSTLRLLVPVLTAFLFAFVVYRIPTFNNSKTITLLSSISYELFLCQGLAIGSASFLFAKSQTLLALPYIFITDIILSYIFLKVSNYIFAIFSTHKA